MTETIVPARITVAQTEYNPNLFYLYIHLRTGSGVGKQFSTEHVELQVICEWLLKWAADKEGFLWDHFQWCAADIDKAILAAPHRTQRHSNGGPLSNITLADLGL